jgi:hypothetical protein
VEDIAAGDPAAFSGAVDDGEIDDSTCHKATSARGELTKDSFR